MEQQYVVGQIVRFVGYTEEPPGGPILATGAQVQVDSVAENGGFNVFDIADDAKADNVFAEEIEPLTEEQMQALGSAVPPAAVETPVNETASLSTEKPAKAKTTKAKTTKAKAGKTAKAKATEPVTTEPMAAEPVTAPAQAATNGHASVPVGQGLVHQPVHTPVDQPDRFAGSGLADYEDSAAVVEILAHQNPLDAASALYRQVGDTYFALGGVLARIYKEGIHKSAGYTGRRGFAEYTEAALDLNYRKAMNLIDLYVTFRRHGLDAERLVEMGIGWSKAIHIAAAARANPAAVVEHFEELLEYAQEHTRDEFKEYIKIEYVSAEDGKPTEEMVKKTTFKFRLFADQASTAEQALALAKQSTGGDDENVAFELITSEWLASTAGTEVSLEHALRTLELRYGVRLKVDDTPQAEVPAEPADAHAHAAA